ncbi:hypothetical protein [Pistricoccus aurantiacus]|uniref:hypothetical protein n=1 Tax=Pistricoccus aurantiacus TaxID=1883414 RepID=UPI00363C5F3D
MYIINTLSITMMDKFPANLHLKEIKPDKAARLAAKMHKVKGVESYVNSADHARIFSETLGIDVAHRPEIFYMKGGDNALLGKYFSPEAPFGSKEIPEGGQLRWFLVEVR